MNTQNKIEVVVIATAHTPEEILAIASGLYRKDLRPYCLELVISDDDWLKARKRTLRTVLEIQNQFLGLPSTRVGFADALMNRGGLTKTMLSLNGMPF